jgi:hypothetical protein
MPAPARTVVLVAGLVAALVLAPGAVAQPEPRSKPSKSSRADDAVRAKYVYRKLPREQRRLKVPGSAGAVHAGLVWLRKHQSAGGRWDCDGFMKHDKGGAPCDGAGNAVHDIGVTGLALLAFLGDGNTRKRGVFSAQVMMGIGWLASQQDPHTGLIGVPASHDFVYDHAVATYALVEAYGLSKDAALKASAQKGLDYLESHRNPNAAWRYQPRDGDNDMSITSWAICAYQAGKDFKLLVNENALKDAADCMDRLTDPTNGRTGYTKRGECSSRHPGDHATRFPPQKAEALTGASLFCRVLLGETPVTQPIMKLQADLIVSKPPKALNDGSIDHYYWYYASNAMYQMGGEHWKRWRRFLHEAVVKTQRQDGNFKGSWDPDGAWGEDGGRIYSTAMAVLALQSEYRYAKLLPD